MAADLRDSVMICLREKPHSRRELGAALHMHWAAPDLDLALVRLAAEKKVRQDWLDDVLKFIAAEAP